MTSAIRIALLVCPEHGYLRGVLRGVTQFARGVDGWTFTIQPCTPDGLSMVARWEPAGVIAAFDGPDPAGAVRGWGVPTVCVSYSGAEPDAPAAPGVGPDEARVGRLAAEHFVGRGFRHFAYCGVPGQAYSEARGRGFASALGGHFREPPQVYDLCRASNPGAFRNHAVPLEALRDWAMSLPRPVAVLAASDARAYELAEVCRHAGLRIPDELALLGVGDDDLYCTLTSPALSSVSVPGEQIGYQAARLLERMLAGKPAPAEPLLLPPAGVTARGSSECYAVNDPNLSAATHFIRAHAHEPIGVDDILRQVPVSRSTLEHRFKNLLGRTMLEEIRRVRVEKARELLGNTDLKVAAVAARTGFGNQARFSVVFRRETGQTPGEYRKQFHVAEDAKAPR